MATLTLRITVVDPPAGVLFCLQDKANALSGHVLSTGEPLEFVVAVERDDEGRVSGRFAMGPPAARFLYICSGASAGQPGIFWQRRAKISLMNLPAGAELAARFAGTAKDGGPLCATVRPLGEGWAGFAQDTHRNLIPS